MSAFAALGHFLCLAEGPSPASSKGQWTFCGRKLRALVRAITTAVHECLDGGGTWSLLPTGVHVVTIAVIPRDIDGPIVMRDEHGRAPGRRAVGNHGVNVEKITLGSDPGGIKTQSFLTTCKQSLKLLGRKVVVVLLNSHTKPLACCSWKWAME